MTIQVSPEYPPQLRVQLRNAFEDARVNVTDDPLKEACPVLCLCEDFKANLMHLATPVFSQPRNDGEHHKKSRRASIISGAINGARQSSRNLYAPRVSDAQSGNEEADAMLRDAVLFYDNAKEFSVYKFELQQHYPHMFKPMWDIWPRQPWLQSAAAKIEVAKMLKRKKKT